MAGINWNPQQVQQVSFNPNQGLAVANSAFKNITDSAANRREAQSLASYRNTNMELANRRQNYVEGEPDRLRAEQERLAEIDRQKMKTAEGFGYGASKMGAERLSEIGPILNQTVPGWSQMTPEQKHKAKVDYVSKNGGADVGGDPRLFAETTRNLLMESDLNYSPKEVEHYQGKLLSQYFSSMDKDTQKMLMQYGPGKEKAGDTYINSGGSSTSSNGSGSKFLSPQVSASGIKDIADIVIQERGLGNPGVIDSLSRTVTDKRLDTGMSDPTPADIRAISSKLYEAGINKPEVIKATLDKAFSPLHPDVLQGDYDWIKNKEGADNLINYAKSIMSKEQQMMDKNGRLLSNAGSSEAQLAESRKYQRMDKILSAGSPKKLSDQELAQRFLRDTFGDNVEMGTPESAPVNRPVEEKTPTVQDQPIVTSETIPQPNSVSSSSANTAPENGRVLPVNTNDPILRNMRADIVPEVSLSDMGSTQANLDQSRINPPGNRLLPADQFPETTGEKIMGLPLSLGNAVIDFNNNNTGIMKDGAVGAVNSFVEGTSKANQAVQKSTDLVLKSINDRKVPQRADLIRAMQSDNISPEEKVYLQKLFLNMNKGAVKAGDRL